MDPNTDSDEVVIETKPLYNVSAWRTHSTDGLQCSQGRDFCYLCTHRSFGNEKVYDEDDNEVPDYHAMITNVIKTLASENNEISTIVRTIHNMYNDEVRNEVVYDHPITRMRMINPAWTMASIERHILYSGMCPEIHDKLVDHIFHGIITGHNKHLVNKLTGRVIESERKGFMDTLKHFTTWRKFRTDKAMKSTMKMK